MIYDEEDRDKIGTQEIRPKENRSPHQDVTHSINRLRNIVRR